MGSASRNLLIFSKRHPENSPEHSQFLNLHGNHWVWVSAAETDDTAAGGSDEGDETDYTIFAIIGATVLLFIGLLVLITVIVMRRRRRRKREKAARKREQEMAARLSLIHI